MHGAAPPEEDEVDVPEEPPLDEVDVPPEEDDVEVPPPDVEDEDALASAGADGFFGGAVTVGAGSVGASSVTESSPVVDPTAQAATATRAAASGKSERVGFTEGAGRSSPHAA